MTAKVPPGNTFALNELHNFIGDFVGHAYFHLHAKFCSELKSTGLLIARRFHASRPVDGCVLGGVCEQSKNILWTRADDCAHPRNFLVAVVRTLKKKIAHAKYLSTETAQRLPEYIAPCVEPVSR